MKMRCLSMRKTIDNESGAVLIIALIMLSLMTIIGAAVSNTSSIETLISGVEKDQKEAFYAAEAGVDHVKGLLKSLFIQRNIGKIAGGLDPDWDFALDGSEAGISAATGTDYDNGATWIFDGAIGNNYTYSVRVWNNSDGGSATDDGDSIIYIRAVSIGSQGSTASIEESIQGSVSDAETITGYTAQAGGGSGKSYSSEDAEAITDFTQQI